MCRAGAGWAQSSFRPTGQVTPEEQPAFGRSYQTPFADSIRNRTGIATVAVGVISSYDDVNSLVLAGRADLCALGRAHRFRGGAARGRLNGPERQRPFASSPRRTMHVL